MCAINVLRQKMCLLIVLLITICAFVLAACGTRSSSIGTEPTPSPSPTSGTVQGYGTAYGCPSDVVVSNAPAAANVTVRPNQGHTTIYIHKGDVLEVQMPFGVAWKGPTTSQGVLELQSPYGYVWKLSNACIWRFVARGTGTVELSFFGSALCKKVILCVPSVLNAGFTIKVG
jgi:hypothetical protein